MKNYGIDLGDILTTDNLQIRFTSYFDDWNAAGGINGRTIDYIPIVYDPIDPSTKDAACAEATLDHEVFMVVNSSGYSNADVDCFTIDNDTFFFYGLSAGLEQFEAAGKNLVAMSAPTEVAAASAAEVAIAEGLVPEGGTVGVLAGNAPASQAAGQILVDTFSDAGYGTVTVAANTLSNDPAIINAEGAAAVATFEAEGADLVMILLAFTNSVGFFGAAGEQGDKFSYMLVDTAASSCTAYGASRTPAEANGTLCITSSGGNSLVTRDGVREDTEFEAECRAHWEATWNAYGEANIEDFEPYVAYPGVPSGDSVTASDGRVLQYDYAASNCTMSVLLHEALTNAGVNPTHESLYDAFMAIGAHPSALHTGGEGSFGEGKPWFDTSQQLVQLQVNATEQALDDSGITYNGCPVPVNCFIPVSGEWVPINY